MNELERGDAFADHDDPPGAWAPARKAKARLLAPIERFLAVEAASGIVLLTMGVVALCWANSPWRASYEALWHTSVALQLGSFRFERDLHFLINDGLMTIFFFVVGLEIRREIHGGELSEWRRAALPLAATLGGMVMPATLYFAINYGHASVRGSGIPMATDIAFAVGVLALLGKRVPHTMRILLLALAVIDDVGAIVAIALFYSTGFDPSGLALMGCGMALLVALQKLGVRNAWSYVPAAMVVWAGCYAAGIHPTLSGVIVGLMTPVRAWFGNERFLSYAQRSVEAVRMQAGVDERAKLSHLAELDLARREAISPVERIERALHGWVAYGIMPLFALANAGVPLGDVSLAGESTFVLAGVIAGLLLGKPLGILLFSWTAVRLGIAVLPRGSTWPQIALVGLLGGVGFTMAIFIAHLAFPSGQLLETAKLGILIASGCAASIAYAIGSVLLPRTSSNPS